MFDKISRVFLVILPFNVILSVFFQFKLGLGFASLYKEILVIILFGMLVFEYYKIKKIPKFDFIDYSIFGYIAYLTIISLVNFAGFKALIYGARYDFLFLIVFLIFRHSRFLLSEKLSYYIKLFLVSGAWALLIGMLVRFVLGENILVHFGFSPNISSWSLGQSTPIYHGIEGASVRRFQGIFDGPNQAAFFIILYIGFLVHYLKQKKDFAIYLFTGVFVLLGLLFLTYSRSSLLGITFATFFLFLLNFKKVFKKYKNEFIIFSILIVFIGSFFYLRYGNNITDIVLRAGSSKGHSERMIIGVKEFVKKPFGAGLASSGPAYRPTHDTTNIDEKFFIPESWFIQQLVEGGIIGFLLFVFIMFSIFLKLYSFSIPITASFIAIMVMNLFLHTFEATYVAVALFAILGIILSSEKVKILKNK
ncbi:O-antigen ligase family protein [Candidatus Gracilibacteria bacterium]|nr:O-antigen ligase family protein [Candidatus Gracilibacteria bacterium]